MVAAPLWEIALRLVLAIFLGGIIGYQREVHEKPAGLRTHALVCLGSALIMIVSVEPFLKIPNVDVTRIASSVVTGIGFLGGGAIIRQGSIVRGLTTAASIWVVSGIGLAVGAGLYIPSVIATALIFMTLTSLVYLEVRAAPSHKTIQLTAVDNPQELGLIMSALGEMNITARTIEIEELEGEGENIIRLELQIPPDISPDTIISRLTTTKGVSEARWITRPLIFKR